MTSQGQLILVATPIGNLGDMTMRGIETLRTADVIACEDTRHTRKLLNHFDIRDVPVIAVHEHNEVVAAQDIIERVRSGKTVAMVTDAGMPGISDPGERVVAALAAANLRVSVVPGASAVPSALAVSGLPTQRFCFEGFLSRKASDRAAHIAEIASETRTVVLYESPHRLSKTVEELAEVCGRDRQVVLVRELTKLHEEIWRGTLDGLVESLADREVKGECVLVLDRAHTVEVAVSDDDILQLLSRLTQSGMSTKDAVIQTTDVLKVSKKRVYALATTKTATQS